MSSWRRQGQHHCAVAWPAPGLRLQHGAAAGAARCSWPTGIPAWIRLSRDECRARDSSGRHRQVITGTSIRRCLGGSFPRSLLSRCESALNVASCEEGTCYHAARRMRRELRGEREIFSPQGSPPPPNPQLQEMSRRPSLGGRSSLRD